MVLSVLVLIEVGHHNDELLKGHLAITVGVHLANDIVQDFVTER